MPNEATKVQLNKNTSTEKEKKDVRMVYKDYMPCVTPFRPLEERNNNENSGYGRSSNRYAMPNR